MSASDIDLLSIMWPLIALGFCYIAFAVGIVWTSFEDLTTLENGHE